MEDSGYDSEDVERGYREEDVDVMESLKWLSPLTTRTGRLAENETGVRGLASDDSSDDDMVRKALLGKLIPRGRFFALACFVKFRT